MFIELHTDPQTLQQVDERIELGSAPTADEVKRVVALRLDSREREHVSIVPHQGDLVVYVSHPRACAELTTEQYRGIQRLVDTLLDGDGKDHYSEPFWGRVPVGFVKYDDRTE
jgi:hypothetical protein